MKPTLSTVAIAIICKTPAAGKSKTRLSPPLRPEECAALSACFIRDLSHTIQHLVTEGDVTGYAIYTPRGSEHDLQPLLPEGFKLVPQAEGDLGNRLCKGTSDLLTAGHAGAILVNSDSPTLPRAILKGAVDAVTAGDNLVLSPALDGGYTLVGMSKLHDYIFADMPWSTDTVYQLTVARAKECGLPVISVPAWYDVDDAASLQMLMAELAGIPPTFAAPDVVGSDAPATRKYMLEREVKRLATVA